MKHTSGYLQVETCPDDTTETEWGVYGKNDIDVSPKATLDKRKAVKRLLTSPGSENRIGRLPVYYL